MWVVAVAFILYFAVMSPGCSGREGRGAHVIEPYRVVGLIPTMRGIRYRDEIKHNLEHLEHLVKAASWLSGWRCPSG